MRAAHLLYNVKTYYSIVVFLCCAIGIISCDIEDGENEFNVVVESPFYVKINVEGNLINANHGLNFKAQTDLSYENGCEVLFNDCNSTEQKVYLASSLGPNEQNIFNIALTNLSLNDIDLNNPDLVKIVNNLPKDDNNSLIFSEGSLTDGITSGNLFIGTVDYKYTYIHEQKSWSSFKITEVKNETIYDKPVVGIRFLLDCILYDEINNTEIFVRNAEGYLPFDLTISN